MIRPLAERLSEALSALREKNQFRNPRRLDRSPGAHTGVEGRPVINFASNNYLNLAEDPRVVSAARAALDRWGAGATGSRLMGGSLESHRELEEALAAHKGTEAALVFPSGYHANVGALMSLLGPADVVVLDRLAHASLVDGARLSRARLKVFRHNDPEDLDRILARRTGPGEWWVVTESVFSMDGDRAPLEALWAVCERRGARLYVDEAHGTGVWGPEGRGAVNAAGLEKKIDVCMGTLSKALGAQGGFVAGSRNLIQWLQNKARAYIYSTALNPAAVAAARKALELSIAEGDRRDRVLAMAQRLRAGLGTAGEGPIVPWVIGSEKETLEVSRVLWEAGVLAPAVRPPTVPAGTARLRFSVTAGHSAADVDTVLSALGKRP